MPDLPDLKFAIGLPPERAIAYFKAKGYAITFDWHELLEEAQVKSFTVAKATRLNILADIREAVQKAQDEGRTQRQFAKELAPKLKAKGWWGKQEVVDPRTGEVRQAQLGSPWRLKTIYETNLATAYAAGRYQEQLENAEAEPYGMYVAVMDARTRPAHAAMNGKVFRLDDPFWGSFYPPNGWNCRCRVRALSGERLERKGLKVESSAGKISRESVRVSRDGRMADLAVYGDPKADVRIQTDPGWAYNPGRTWMDTMGPKLAASLASAPREAAEAALRETVRSDGFKRFYERPEGEWPVLRLPDEAAKAIRAQDPVAQLSGETLVKNKLHHPDLSLEDYQTLPELGTPDLAVRDGDQTVVLVRKGKAWYWGAIKATRSGEGTFLTSFRKTSAADVERLRRKGEIVWPK